MYSQAPQAGLASLLASRGRGEDTMLVHMTPGEVKALQGIANAAGGSLTVNPSTGLPEAGFLKELLPTIAGGLLKSVFPGMGEFGIGLLTAGATGLIEGDLKKGLMAGMGAYSGAKITSGLTQLGREEAARRRVLDKELAIKTQIGRKEFGLEPVDFKDPVAAVKAANATSLSDLGIVQTKTPFVSPTQLQAPGTFGLRPLSERAQQIDLSDVAEKVSAETSRELADTRRPTRGEFSEGIKALFRPKGFERFQSAVGGPEQLGFITAPILGAVQRAEDESAQRKFARSQTPNYYYVPGEFNFQTGTFAPGGYYTAPGKPYTPKTGFAGGGIVFQEGGDIATQSSAQPTQFMPPANTGLIMAQSPSQMRRADTLAYVDWLNQFLKQRPVQSTTTPVGTGVGSFYTPELIDQGDLRDIAGPPAASIPTAPPPSIKLTDEDLTPDVRPPASYDFTSIPPSQVGGVGPPPMPLTEEEKKGVIGIEEMEPGTLLLEDVIQPYMPIGPGPDLRDVGITYDYLDDLSAADRRELTYGGDYLPPTGPLSASEALKTQRLTEPDLFFQGPTNEELQDLVSLTPPPEISQNVMDRVKDAVIQAGPKLLTTTALAALAAQLGVPLALVSMAYQTITGKKEGEKEAPAELPAEGSGGGGDGAVDYYNPFYSDPYTNFYTNPFRNRGGGGGVQCGFNQDGEYECKVTTDSSPSFGFAQGGMIGDTNPVKVLPMSKGLGTEDLRLMRMTGATGPGYNFGFAQGGLSSLQYAAGGKLLNGPGDGMSDDIKANIDGQQEARLADGEFVVPADVVSHLGNGSTDAGAKKLYAMMDRVRKARTGSPKQGRQIDPNKFLPA